MTTCGDLGSGIVGGVDTWANPAPKVKVPQAKRKFKSIHERDEAIRRDYQEWLQAAHKVVRAMTHCDSAISTMLAQQVLANKIFENLVYLRRGVQEVKKLVLADIPALHSAAKKEKPVTMKGMKNVPKPMMKKMMKAMRPMKIMKK